MFCSSCGTCMQISFKFCPSCGKGKVEDKGEHSRNAASSSNESKESKNSRPNTSFKEFMSKKNEENASNFRPSKKARVADIANKQEVSINIGIMELNEEAVGIPLRGKSLPLKIAKEVDYDTLLASALKKRRDYEKTFDCERAYKLVYPDGQSAQTIPGSFELFTLVKYKQGLGKS